MSGYNSAFAVFKAWGNDLGRTVEIGSQDGFERMYPAIDGGDLTKAPGVVKIPICSWPEIREVMKKWPTIYHKDKPKNYPCKDVSK
jgi:hypothetical protein